MCRYYLERWDGMAWIGLSGFRVEISGRLFMNTIKNLQVP
jgi:hypothetical protein